MASPTIFLAESLKIIHGFQLLSPSLLSHINFDLRKLLSGQQEAKLPVIAQQLTLWILLHAPPGSLKWFQQVGVFRQNINSFTWTCFVHVAAVLYYLSSFFLLSLSIYPLYKCQFKWPNCVNLILIQQLVKLKSI